MSSKVQSLREMIESDTIIKAIRADPGGQVVGMGTQTLEATLPDFGITIRINYSRSQHKARKLLWDLIEYAISNGY